MSRSSELERNPESYNITINCKQCLELLDPKKGDISPFSKYIYPLEIAHQEIQRTMPSPPAITSSDVAAYFSADEAVLKEESSSPVLKEENASLQLVSPENERIRDDLEKKTDQVEEVTTAVALVEPSTLEPQEDRPVPKRANGWKQLAALTEKNLIAKSRAKVSTIFEILTPAALASLLVLGFMASSVTYIDSRQFANLTLDLPGVFAPLVLGTINGFPNLLASSNDTNMTENENGSASLGLDFLGVLDDLLTHPLPIPTLGQFVALATTVKLSLGNITSSEFYTIIKGSEYGRSLQNVLDLGTLHLSPSGPIADSFVKFINDTYPLMLDNSSTNLTSPLIIKIHDTADKALVYITENSLELTWALIDLSNSYPSASVINDSSGELLITKKDLNSVTFTIRMNYTTIPNTNWIINGYEQGLNPKYQQYYMSGFLTLQRTMQEFAFAQAASTLSSSNDLAVTATCQLPSTLQIWSMPMPTPEYNENEFFAAAGFLLGLVASLGFLYPMSRLVKSLVEEKELRIKETLQILGVKPWAYSLSWVIISSIIFLLGSIFISLLLHLNVISHSSQWYLLALFALFSSAIIGFSFFVAAFFSKAKLAAIMGPIALFSTILPYWIFLGSNSFERANGKIFASLLPCTALSFGANILAELESAGIGVHSYNASEGDYSYNTCLLMLAFDTVLFFFLGWYLELVLPSSYGVRRPFYFFLLPSYWGCRKPKVWCQENADERNRPRETEAANFELVGTECGPPKVIISDLVKRYKKIGSNAVDHLSLNLYENQITCLLGHNGAGKTSAISVMTGLYPATSGECTIYGYPVSSSLEKARESMGICPQHDVLFADLTVSEHLRLFEKIKGINPTFDTIQKRANDVGIGDKLNALSSQLSGGMKRKLSIAIAMCGDPKFILLDEPTTGMDPYARRATWEMLRNAKQNRVILLTTHYMDEAEVLSDHIAVMKTGQLQCFGTPLFLKKRFGLGYTLTVILNNFQDIPSLNELNDINSSEVGELENGLGLPHRVVSNQVDSKADHAQMILAFLQHFIPDTQVIRFSGRECKFRFPNGFEHKFPSLFDAFEKDGMRDRLGIGGYGVTNSSLEEVFLRLAEEVPSNVSEVDNSVIITPGATSSSVIHSDLHEGLASAMQGNAVSKSTSTSYQPIRPNRQNLGPIGQVCILLRKRSVVQRRDITGFVFMIILPALVIALVLLILTFNPPIGGPPIPMSLGLFKKEKRASVVIGGESPLQTNEASILELEDFLISDFSFVDIDKAVGVNSSAEMSKHLLKTYGSHNHAPRLGSYVVNDNINVNLNINWDDFSKMLNITDLVGSSSLNGLIDSFGLMSTNLTGANVSGFDQEGLLAQLIPTIPEGQDSFLLPLKTSISILHNTSSPHGVAALNNDYANYHYRQCTENGSISIVNYPLPISIEKSLELRAILSIMCSLFILIPLCFVPSAFIVFVVKEKACKSKHVQLVSGVNLTSFWAAHYIWDMMMFSILTALIMAIFAMYGSKSAQVFVGDTSSFFATTLLIYGYGVSALPFSYLFSRTFDNHSSAQLAILGLFFVTGFVLVNAQFILSTIESTKQVAIELRPFFRLFPAFNVGDGLIKLGTSFYAKEILGLDSSPFDWDVAGAPICFLFVLSVPYFVLLLILEYSGDGGSGGFVGYALRKVQEYLSDMQLKWNGIRRNSEGELLLDDGLDIDADEDEDVIIEKKRVVQNEAVLRKSAKILILNLWKVYPPSVSKFGQSFMQCLRCAWCCCCCQGKVAENRKSDTSTLPKRALRGVTLAIESGETFGLLGVNGAGKTTAMAILTGDTPASMGQVYVAGYDVTGHTPQGVSEARKHIGFCPQIDPLLDLMTGRETLRMFAGLRGIPPGQLDATVDHLLNALTLTPHSDKAAGTYSGGNKRKLSLGIALIGEPDVLLIDEASSGMDPAARRKIWDLISQIADNRLVVLTTHSMEEAEALCTRLTILVGGKMKCIGSVQHLKSKYLGGYTLDLQLQSPATLEAVKRHVIEIGLPFALLKEEHGLFLRFSIPSLSSNGVTLSLGSVFSALESMKNDISLMVREYSLAQSTLEEVFINFARDDDQGFGATNT